MRIRNKVNDIYLFIFLIQFPVHSKLEIALAIPASNERETDPALKGLIIWHYITVGDDTHVFLYKGLRSQKLLLARRMPPQTIRSEYHTNAPNIIIGYENILHSLPQNDRSK